MIKNEMIHKWNDIKIKWYINKWYKNEIIYKWNNIKIWYINKMI